MELICRFDVNESTARFTDNGAVELYYDGSLKLSTAAGGVNIAGNINLNSADNYEVRFGANNDQNFIMMALTLGLILALVT